ncbi:Lrp/AsnC family transcriptional regulator [Marinomonas sp. 15G1-11]|mgnify:CR=1 FL=1|uniref:Lrp/AsnC family transcriptional regulator n=1 Tax=Marinomonas phaeophyticola TaxID=3004091 RepID=A0ABT4JQR5_9GAMM|nr:Lrp/AsnC family transcriptional regulator [Marinomonas sp. 15G1-11]MCZ2720732.1 Lrp/AsnC family transcriptional regulator [Marinomonas sp. 15G1-11]
MKTLDSIDQELINLLSENSRTPVSELAKKMNVARTTVNNRLERLERRKVIERYTLKLSSTEYSGWLTATVLIKMSQEKATIVFSSLKKSQYIQKVVTLSGTFDLQVTLRVDSTETLDRELDYIGKIEGVIRSETFIQLSTKINKEIL